MKKEWTVEWTSYARKQLLKLPAQVKLRILQKLHYWEQQENPLMFAKATPALKYASHRFRVGDYRLLCKLEKKQLLIIVIKVGHRSVIYSA